MIIFISFIIYIIIGFLIAQSMEVNELMSILTIIIFWFPIMIVLICTGIFMAIAISKKEIKKND